MNQAAVDPLRSLKHDDPQRLAYTLEINPWVPDLYLKNAVLFRGAVVSAWGYIETKLIELAIRSSRMPEYSAIRATYPYKLDNRFGYMRRVLASEGPFSKYRSIGKKFLDRFEASADLRHLMAHGDMQALPDWGVTFVDYRPNSKDSLHSDGGGFVLKNWKLKRAAPQD